MAMNKKAISPVVATALLLVVAVVAVVGFQTWYSSYQSQIEAQVESQAETGVQVQSERVEVTEEVNMSEEYDWFEEGSVVVDNSVTVYLSAPGEIELNSLSVGEYECFSEELDSDDYPNIEGLTTLYCDSGVDSEDLDGQVELLIESDDQVYSFTEIVR